MTNIRKLAVQAMSDYDMLAPHDRVLVAVSGGKDSAVLLYLFHEIRKKAPFPFTFTPVLLDQKQPGFAVEKFRTWVNGLGTELIILEEDTYSIVKAKTAPGKSYCGLCSRLRRGILYTYAHEHGFTKIALGHHRDDANETVLMNMFYAGALASMPPKLLSDDGRNTVIRPLCYVAESDIRQAAEALQVPTIPCNLCGSQDGLRRKKIKQLLANLAAEDQHLPDKLWAAQANLKPSQLADRRFWRNELTNHAKETTRPAPPLSN